MFVRYNEEREHKIQTVWTLFQIELWRQARFDDMMPNITVVPKNKEQTCFDVYEKKNLLCSEIDITKINYKDLYNLPELILMK